MPKLPEALAAVYVTSRQAAKLFGVTRERVRVWIDEGRIPAERIGYNVLIRKENLIRPPALRPWGLSDKAPKPKLPRRRKYCKTCDSKRPIRATGLCRKCTRRQQVLSEAS